MNYNVARSGAAGTCQAVCLRVESLKAVMLSYQAAVWGPGQGRAFQHFNPGLGVQLLGAGVKGGA